MRMQIWIWVIRFEQIDVWACWRLYECRCVSMCRTSNSMFICRSILKSCGFFCCCFESSAIRLFCPVFFRCLFQFQFSADRAWLLYLFHGHQRNNSKHPIDNCLMFALSIPLCAHCAWRSLEHHSNSIWQIKNNWKRIRECDRKCLSRAHCEWQIDVGCDFVLFGPIAREPDRIHVLRK